MSRSLIFFVLFYLYLWLGVDLRFMYYGAGVITNFPAFYKGWAFFLTFLSYPGGPLEWVEGFIWGSIKKPPWPRQGLNIA